MATQLARVAKMLSKSPSARNVCTTTKLSQSVVAGVTKPVVPGGERRSHGESSGQRRQRRSWRWSSRSRKTEGVKGPRAVTSEKRTSESQILHSKPKGVKIDRTGIVGGELANGKKIVNNVGSNKHIRETERTGSGTHGGDRKTRAIADHDRGRTRGIGGSDGRKDASMRCGVEQGARVGNPVGADWRCQPHGTESLCRWNPGRWERGSGASEHGRWLGRRTRTPWGRNRPHREVP